MDNFKQSNYAVGGDFWIGHAMDVIENEFGQTVDIAGKSKDLLKFGRNHLVGTSLATIQHQPAGVLHETYVSTNLINSIISTATADGESVIVEGHTISDGVFTFVTQTITLNGRTKVALSTALARVTRVVNDDSTLLAGAVSVTETDTYTLGDPDTDALVHLQIDAGEQQSEKASTTISNLDYWIVTGFYADIMDKTAAFAEVHLECRLKGKVFIDINMKAVTDSNDSDFLYKPYLIIPPNSDIRLVAKADGASTDISGGIQGFLASVVT